MHGGRECARGGAAWAGCRPMALGAVGPKLGARSVPGGGDATPLIHFSPTQPYLTSLPYSPSPPRRVPLCAGRPGRRNATQPRQRRDQHRGRPPGHRLHVRRSPASSIRHRRHAGREHRHDGPQHADAQQRTIPRLGCSAQPAAARRRHGRPPPHGTDAAAGALGGAVPAGQHGAGARHGTQVRALALLFASVRIIASTRQSPLTRPLSLSLYVRVQQAPQASGAAGHQACDGVPSRSCHAG